MDAADIAWKLALVVRGAAKPSLLDSYVTERALADHDVLEVSDETHRLVMGLVAMCEGGRLPALQPGDAAQNVAKVRRRLMLDVSYAGSALVGQASVIVEGPSPGERFPASHRLGGTGHHLLVFGGAPRLGYLRMRWVSSSRLSTLQVRNSTRPRLAYPTAGLSSCGRTASSGSALSPPTKRRWPHLMPTWRRISSRLPPSGSDGVCTCTTRFGGLTWPQAVACR